MRPTEKENRLNIRCDISIGLPHLELRFEVERRPQTPCDDARVLILAEIHDESVEALRDHVVEVRDALFEELSALFLAKKTPLGRMTAHPEDDVFEDACRTLHDVHMPVRHRVEAPGVYRRHTGAALLTACRSHVPSILPTVMRFDPQRLLPCFAACLAACGPANAPPRQVSSAGFNGSEASNEREMVGEAAAASRSSAGLRQGSKGPPPSREQITAMVEASAAALRAGNRPTAERSLQPCLNRTPLVLMCELQLARFLETVPRRKDEYQATLRRMVIVNDDSVSAEAYDELAERLRAAGDMPRSEAAVGVSLARAPTAARHMLHAKILQGDSTRLEDAIAALTKAVAGAPERNDWMLDLATLSARHPAHLDDAIVLFETIREGSTDKEFRRTLDDRIAELRRTAAARVPADARPTSPMNAPNKLRTPPAAEGGSTSR